MKCIKKLSILFALAIMINCYIQTAVQAVTLPAVAPKGVAPKAVIPVHVPYLKELQDAKMSPAILSGWQELYASIESTNTRPAGTPSIATNPLFTTNFFDMMANYLNPTTFPKFTNDPNGQIHFNYATNHLRAAAMRLGSISSIINDSGTPKVNFTGDCRDMGIIVNIQNNTDAQFSINQTLLDGKSTIQIGQLNPGLNEVNLHTAALQSPTAATTAGSAKTTTPTKYYFEIVESITDPSININLKILSGAELISFLESLPHKKDDTIEMNGLATSTKYLATPTDWYLVLIQNPTQPGASQANPDQRIQAINLSKLSGPYLLTIQINQESIEIKATKSKQTTAMTDVSQPSLNTVLEVKNKSFATQNYPLIILPQFLWTISTLQAYWILLNSCYIAAFSNFKFFGPQTFGDAFQYFTGLGCFDMNNKYAFISDLYNLLTSGDTFHDATWLMGSALYATNLNYCSDFPQLHSSQDSDGNIISNGSAFIYLNFQIKLHPQNNQTSASLNLFKQYGFHSVYTQPEYQLWTTLCSILMTEIKEGVFAELTETQKGIYQLTWTNKQNKVLNQQILHLNTPCAKVEILFINRDKNWTGSIVPPHLLNLKVGMKNDFKVTYESMPTANKHLLSVQPTSPIDKSRIIHTTYILKAPKTNHPISTLYYDLYEIFQSADFTRCQIIQNGNLPQFLSNLTIQDWKNGIYIIPNVPNQKSLNAQNAGSLIVSFYKSNKILLGQIQSQGLYQNDPNKPGIRHPVKLSTTYSNAFKPMLEGSLTSGLLVKYK